MTIYDCPAMSWQDFLNIPNGETVFNHGASECVALANLYNEGVLGGGFVQVGAALQWWTNPNVAAVHGFTPITSNPQAGDIFIASCGLYDCNFGHIGVVVRSWDGSTFGTMEQNVYGEFVSRHNRTMDNVDGFLRPINQAAISTPSAPALAGNQRIAGPNGANRRAAPTTESEILEPHLDAGVVGNFVNFIHGQDPYGNGNDIWFQGISGHWFYSGAFEDQGTHDLNDVTVYAPTPVEPTPVVPTPTEPTSPPKEEVVITIETEKEKEITVTKPSVKPENIEHKEDTMSTPSAKPSATDAQIKKLIATSDVWEPIQDPNAPIIPDNVAKPLWLVLALVSSSTPYAFGLTVVNWGAWDANIATQAAALIVAWSGTLASVLGLSRFSKSSAK